MEHILLCGRRRSGRSAMIRKLLENVTAPVFGYETLTLRTRSDGYHEIYLFPYGTENPQPCEARHAADCNTRQRVVHPEVFNSLGTRLLQGQKRGVLVMDEIGFLESDAAEFCSAVLRRLDGDLPVLAAVRTGMDTAFLREVCAHKKARCIQMNPVRFDEIHRELLPLVRSWNLSLRESAAL